MGAHPKFTTEEIVLLHAWCRDTCADCPPLLAQARSVVAESRRIRAIARDLTERHREMAKRIESVH